MAEFPVCDRISDHFPDPWTASVAAALSQEASRTASRTASRAASSAASSAAVREALAGIVPAIAGLPGDDTATGISSVRAPLETRMLKPVESNILQDQVPNPDAREKESGILGEASGSLLDIRG